MLKVDLSNNITLTRGDTMTLTVNINESVPPVPPDTRPTARPYVPEEGDSLRFAISKGYKGTADYQLMLSKDIDLSSMKFTCAASETVLDYGTYNYDVELTHADGTVDTFISAKIKIIGEVM